MSNGKYDRKICPAKAWLIAQNISYEIKTAMADGSYLEDIKIEPDTLDEE